MSISAHGRSRLNCVCRCSSGFRSAASPAIHIFAGENVCIHATTPTHVVAAFASRITARIASGLVATPFSRRGREPLPPRRARRRSRARAPRPAAGRSAPYISWLPATSQTSNCSSAFIARTTVLALSPALARPQRHDGRGVGCSDRVAGLGVEEVEAIDVDRERELIADGDPDARIDARDAFGRRRAGDVSGSVSVRVCREDAAAVADRPRVGREVDERLVAERLDELGPHGERPLASGFCAVRRRSHGQVLGPDPDHELASLGSGESRAAPPDVGRKREPLRSEREDEPIRRPRDRRLVEVHRRRADERGDEQVRRAARTAPAARRAAGACRRGGPRPGRPSSSPPSGRG